MLSHPEHQEAKQVMDHRKSEGRYTALVHMTADLLHVGHIDYIQEINRRLKEILDYPHKLMVGVEADDMTQDRKGKQNVYNEIERKFIMENIKGVDHAFIYRREHQDQRPYPVSQRLAPDVRVTHEEYAPTIEDEQELQKRTDSKVLVIREHERREEGMRQQHNRTTTDTIKRILKNYKDHIKYKQ